RDRNVTGVQTCALPISRAIAGGEDAAAGRRLRTDLQVVATLVLLAGAYLIALAPTVVEVLFQHGRFTAADTAATAAVMRVYVLRSEEHTSELQSRFDLV